MDPLIRGVTEICVVDLALRLHARVSPIRGLAAITSLADLPARVAEVVKAVAERTYTSGGFAQARSISISNASERFRVARQVGWTVPVDGRYLHR